MFVPEHSPTDFGPMRPDGRNVAVDQMRGAAVLGIFYMVVSAYGLQHAAFYRLEVDSDSAFDWVAAFVGHVAFDLKASALLVLVFGAGIAHLMDRAEAHGRSPKRFLLWRILVLFLIGIPPGVHATLWEGNYHLFVALFSTVTVVMFRRSRKTQLVTGVSLVVFSLAVTPLFQATFAADGLGLSQYWWSDDHPFYRQAPSPDNHPTGYFIATISTRVAGTTLLGSALYRYDVIQGHRDSAFYRKLGLYGFLIGLPLSIASFLWMLLAEYDPTVALVGHMPNAAAAIPMALGYVALIVLWGKNNAPSPLESVKQGLQSVGRMALTNSIIYTVAGMFILRDGLGRNYFSRAELALMAVAAAVALLMSSAAWLKRFDYGPFEWLLRVVTYRRRPTLSADAA